LWNQISSGRSYYENSNDSEFVEVYLNNEYNGLYVLREPVDRKQLNLNKKTDVDSGIMIKGYNHGSYNFDNYTIKNILKPFEMKYPQNIEDYSSYWEILNNKMKNYYYNNDNSDKVLKETFNIDNLIDYRIFLNATYAADNYDSKNTIISMKSIKDDSKLIFTPWDLDETFGRVYDEEISEIHVKTVHNEYEDYTGVLFEDGAAEYNSKLKERYLELRKNVLSIDNINSLIDEYYNLLSINAYFKENKRWNKEYDIDEEITFIKEWVSNRLDYLDKLIGDYDV
jgi:hypothetical protein